MWARLCNRHIPSFFLCLSEEELTFLQVAGWDVVQKNLLDVDGVGAQRLRGSPGFAAICCRSFDSEAGHPHLTHRLLIGYAAFPTWGPKNLGQEKTKTWPIFSGDSDHLTRRRRLFRASRRPQRLPSPHGSGILGVGEQQKAGDKASEGRALLRLGSSGMYQSVWELEGANSNLICLQNPNYHVASCYLNYKPNACSLKYLENLKKKILCKIHSLCLSHLYWHYNVLEF